MQNTIVSEIEFFPHSRLCTAEHSLALNRKEIYVIGTIVSSVAQIRADTFALSNVLNKSE